MKTYKNPYGTFALTDDGEFQILDDWKIKELRRLGYSVEKLADILKKAENKLRKRRR